MTEKVQGPREEVALRRTERIAGAGTLDAIAGLGVGISQARRAPHFPLAIGIALESRNPTVSERRMELAGA
jgi:hypothetical protein